MLRELLNEFTNHQNFYPEFDVDTMVLENYRLKPGLYVRLNKNNSLDDIFIGKKATLPENNSLLEWFMYADYSSNLINLNKSLDTKKQIHSNNVFTLFCKHDVFMKDGRVNPELKEHIQRYFNTFLTTKDKESTAILSAAGYETLEEEIIRNNENQILSSLEAVAERILTHSIKDNCYIKIFLDAEKEAYAYESGRYLIPKIFNKNDFNISIDGKVLGLSNTNMGMNSKKPYLEHKTAPFKVPYRVTAEEGILLRKLFLWFNGQAREGKPIFSGYIPIWDHSPELMATASEVDVRRPVNYIHYDKGIDVTVDDYDFLPSFNDKMDNPVIFKNYLDAPKYQGGRMDRLSAVEKHIDENLYAFQLVRNYYGDINVSERLPQKLADQIILYRDAMCAWLRKGNMIPIKNCVNKLTKGVLLARLQSLEYVPALAPVLNVRLSLLNYFKTEEKDMGFVIENSYRELKSKVLDTKTTAFCNSTVEFYLSVGQLLRYYFSLSEAQSLQYDALLRGIVSAKNCDEVKKEYIKYFNKYGYKIDVNNPRYNNMLAVASSFVTEKEEPVNLDALFFGFASDNIIYYKNKEDSENEKI